MKFKVISYTCVGLYRVQYWAIGITCMQRIVKYCRRVLIWLLSVQQLNAFVNTLYIVLLNNVFYLKICSSLLQYFPYFNFVYTYVEFFNTFWKFRIGCFPHPYPRPPGFYLSHCSHHNSFIEPFILSIIPSITLELLYKYISKNLRNRIGASFSLQALVSSSSRFAQNPKLPWPMWGG